MNDQIFETVVTTVGIDGRTHVAPMGVRYQAGRVVLMPFKPSTTLDNIIATGHAVLNLVTDTRIFADIGRVLELVGESTMEQRSLVFGLTHTYTGYPAVIEARERVRSGQVGAAGPGGGGVDAATMRRGAPLHRPVFTLLRAAAVNETGHDMSLSEHIDGGLRGQIGHALEGRDERRAAIGIA